MTYLRVLVRLIRIRLASCLVFEERERELVLVKQPWNHYNLVSRTRVASYLSLSLSKKCLFVSPSHTNVSYETGPWKNDQRLRSRNRISLDRFVEKKKRKEKKIKNERIEMEFHSKNSKDLESIKILEEKNRNFVVFKENAKLV